jgi:hypothetical protein
MSWFFERTNKIDKPLAKVTKRNRGPKLIKLEIKKDTTESQRIIRELSEDLDSNKLKKSIRNG